MEYLIPSDDQVRLLSQFVDSMWLGGLYWTYHHMEKENQATPRQMLKLLIYAYMNYIYSSRGMEEACRRDINFMWLLEGKEIKSYIKPSNCEVSKSRKYRNDIGRMENMTYDSERDVYMCHEGRE